MQRTHTAFVLGLTALALLCLVAFGVRQYDGNISALLHMDVPFGELHNVPEGLVVYEDAGYDGMLYYQVTRDLPALFTDGQTSLDSPYRFQRILLPLLTYAFTLGNADAFPYAILAINIVAALGALLFMLRMTKGKILHALTTVFNPAILVGILYMLTEPVSLFLIVLFLFAFQKNNHRLNVATLTALTLSLLARETTVFLIGLLFLWFLWNKEWKQAALIVIPILLLVLWQYFLVLRLGSVAFQANSNIIDLPFQGPVQIFMWLMEGKKVTYVLSSIGLFCFVLPLFLHLCREWIQKRTRVDILAFLTAGLTVTMLMMDSHMWGAITSIGRVVTPIYPVYALYAAARDTKVERVISMILIVVSIVAAIGIASVTHPYVLS